MKGYILLADGFRLDGEIVGPGKAAIAWLVANTSVVGFQEMVTDPAYKGTILTFTYPEVGNVGVAAGSSEGGTVQVEGLVVKVLSEYWSHYMAEGAFGDMLLKAEVPCLTGIDTRALAVRLRDAGEMPAVIAPEDSDAEALKRALAVRERPEFRPSKTPAVHRSESMVRVAVLNLGARRSLIEQLSLCSALTIFPSEAAAEEILAARPAGVVISDGPGTCLPPMEAVDTVKELAGKVPLLGCGLGHVALGMALKCAPLFLKRGHHGANYPVRNVVSGKVEVTQQRHTVALDRRSLVGKLGVELLSENVNDGTVEGVRATGVSAVGFQQMLVAPYPGTVNAHIKSFVDGLSGP